MTPRARQWLGYTLPLTAYRVNCELGPGPGASGLHLGRDMASIYTRARFPEFHPQWLFLYRATLTAYN